MKILIFGTGAMGSAFGGFLSRSDHEIYLYGRPWHLNAIRRRGLKVTGIWGHHTFRKFKLVTDFTILERTKPYDLILLTVKSFDTEKAARELRRIVSPKTLLVTIQNGLGNIETLHRFFPKKQVLAARVIFGVEIWPGKIKITVSADRVLVGETALRKVTPRVRALASLFTNSGIKARTVADIRKPLWAKVIYNAALNPLASLLGVHYGALLEIPVTRELMKQIVDEIYQTAARLGLRLEPKTAKAYTKLLFERLTPATYDHHPSMLQDLLKGNRTEIDAMNGAIVRLGARAGIRTPINQLITSLVKMRETLKGESPWQKGN